MAKLHSCVKIVLNLVFNEKNEILLIQEAKEHSRELWFLPAGKVKEGESIIDGLLRETKEEAGIEVEPLSLMRLEHLINKVYIEVEPTSIDIFRFIIVSKPKDTNEELKSVESKDSIQAKWCKIEDVFNGKYKLRSYEVVDLLEYYLNNKEKITNNIFDIYQFPLF